MLSGRGSSESRQERHTAKRLRTVLDAVPVPISWARLDDSRIVFMNRKFFQVFGYRVDDFATVQEWVEKAYPNPAHRARTEASWYKYFANPTVEEFEIDPEEVDVKCKDGSTKTAILGGVILPSAGVALASFVDISDRKRAEMLIRYLAEQEPITGLPNRRAFDAYLARSIADAIRDNTTVHLRVLDLDHFKTVNDNFGHLVGDQVLAEAGVRFRACVRNTDTVARFGGDGFGIVLANADSDANVDRICEKIIESFADPIVVSGRPVGVSIGIGRLPRDANTDHALFVTADKALFPAKSEGRKRWCYG